MTSGKKTKDPRRFQDQLKLQPKGLLSFKIISDFGRTVIRPGGGKLWAALLLVVGIVLSWPLPVWPVMESSNYRIPSDSLNVGGGRSQSAGYFQESTVGEIASGLSESAGYRLKAGYQQMQEVYLAFSAVGNLVLAPELGGITGGTSNDAVQFRVTTDSAAGFNVTIKSDSDSGMIDDGGSGRFISHLDVAPSYTPQFSFTSAPANSSAFAYTINASSTDEMVAAFLNNGSVCGAGSNNTDDNCWIAATTTPRIILSRASRTPLSGSTSTLRFRVIIAANHNPTLPANSYTATTTLTAVAL